MEAFYNRYAEKEAAVCVFARVRVRGVSKVPGITAIRRYREQFCFITIDTLIEIVLRRTMKTIKLRLMLRSFILYLKYTYPLYKLI